LDGDLRFGQQDVVTKIVADGNLQVSIEPDGASEIDAAMLTLSSECTDEFQALFLGNQAGDAGTHLTSAE
jgi:hypothetical protein